MSTAPIMNEVQVAGLRIAYRQSGAGPPLVLVHGGMEDSRAWSPQFDDLSDEFTVLAWDAPGCGRSSDIPETWRLNDYADALANWLGAIGIVHPHVLGLSFGSSVVLELYRRHSALPASLILTGAYAGWAGSLPADEVALRLASVLAGVDASKEEVLRSFPGIFSPAASPELIEGLRQIAVDNSGRAHPGGYRAMAYSMAEGDLRDVLPRIVVPTLLVYGELDARSPLSVAETLRSSIPGAQLVVIPGVGHVANLENPQAFNREVRQFVRGVTRMQ